MTTIGVTELRSQLKAVLERVRKGEEFTITQNDEAVAALLHPSKLRLRAKTPRTVAAEELLTEMERLRQNPPPLEGVLSPGYAEALVQRLREERESSE